MPAPKGNINAIRHGLASQRMPKGCGVIHNQCAMLRNEIAGELFAIYGEEVPIMSRALLQSTIRHEQMALLAYRYLRKLGDNAPLAERMAVMGVVSKETDARDTCLKKMELAPKSKGNMFSSLLANAIETTSPPPATPEEPTDATDPS